MNSLNLEISYLKVVIVDLLVGMGKRGIEIEEQIRMLRQIADDLEITSEEELAKALK